MYVILFQVYFVGKDMKIKKTLIIIGIILLSLIILCVGFVLTINGIVIGKTKDKIISEEKSKSLSDVDCILVLGCGVKSNGEPSDMLEDRLLRGIEVYNLKSAPKLLMSGDHGQPEYDEVNTMKNFAIQKGVPSTDIFMDHAGFSTYESIYRAKEIFGAEKVIIVTQKYHLYRALYIAEKLSVEAYGVSSDYRKYIGQTPREIREILARNKDFFTLLVEPEPTYLGEKISVDGDGDVTND